MAVVEAYSRLHFILTSDKNGITRPVLPGTLFHDNLMATLQAASGSSVL